MELMGTEGKMQKNKIFLCFIAKHEHISVPDVTIVTSTEPLFLRNARNKLQKVNDDLILRLSLIKLIFLGFCYWANLAEKFSRVRPGNEPWGGVSLIGLIT